MVFWVITPPGIVGVQMFWRNILPPSSAIYCDHRVMIFGDDIHNFSKNKVISKPTEQPWFWI
jgi:hypothetical protein